MAARAPLLQQALLEWDPELVRPLAVQAVQCLETDMPPLHECVTTVLHSVHTTQALWALRLAVFMALQLSPAFRHHLYHHSASERDRVAHFLATLQQAQWAHLRGGPPAAGGVCPPAQQMVLTLTRLYLKHT
jgi:hypothetical protein